MPNASRVTNQFLSVDINLDVQRVQGSTVLDVLQKKESREIRLHARQMEIESVTVNDVPAQFVLDSHLDEIVPKEANKQIRDMLNFTLRYKQALELSDFGELRIWVPRDYDGNNAVTPLPAPEGSHESLGIWKVHIRYSLVAPAGGLLFAGGIPGDVPAHCYTDGQVTGARLWFPCNDSLDTAYPLEIKATVNSGNTVVCSLPLQKSKDSKGQARFSFKSVQGFEVPVRAVALAAGPFIKLDDPSASHRISYYCLPHANAEQRLTFSTQYVSRSAALLEQSLSASLPGQRYNLVFVSHPPQEIDAQPSLTIASSSLLYDSTVLEQSFRSVRLLVSALVKQWFGINSLLRPEAWADCWLLLGLSGHITNLCLRKLHGNSAYAHNVLRDVQLVCASELPTTPPLYSEGPAHPVEHTSEHKARKASLVIRLVEKRIGEANFWKVVAYLLGKTEKGAELMSTKKFFKAVRKCSGQDIEPGLNHWIYGSGCPVFTANFNWNRKRNQIEFAMRVSNEDMRTKSKQDGITVRIHETEVTYDRTVKLDVDEFIVDEFAHQSRGRKTKKEKEAEKEGEPEVVQEMMDRNDTPLLWIRVDPELMWMRRVEMSQADYMWVYQLYKDRDVVAQCDAIDGLCKPLINPQRDPTGIAPSVPDYLKTLSIRVLLETIADSQIFYQVRAKAAEALGQLQVLTHDEGQSEWIGLPELVKAAKKMMFDDDTQLPAPNDFTKLSEYFVRRAVVEALATARERAGEDVSGEVHSVLLTLLKHNDNSQNEHCSDGDWVACLLLNTARAATTAPGEATKTQAQIQRYFLRDMLMPSFGHAVTAAALRASQILQLRRLAPFDPALFLKHAKVGQSTEVRSAALECLVRLSPLQPRLLHLLFKELLPLETVPRVRQAVLRSFLDGTAKHLRTSRILAQSLSRNVEVVHAIWGFINHEARFDVQSRYLSATVYSAVFGEQIPDCMLDDSPGFHAASLRPVPTARELDSLRFEPKLTLKLQMTPKGILNKGSAAVVSGKKKRRGKKGSDEEEEDTDVLDAAKGGKYGGEKINMTLEEEKKAAKEKQRKDQEERDRRFQEREMLRSVREVIAPQPTDLPAAPAAPKLVFNWPPGHHVEKTRHVKVNFTCEPPAGRGNTPPPLEGWAKKPRSSSKPRFTKEKKKKHIPQQPLLQPALLAPGPGKDALVQPAQAAPRPAGDGDDAPIKPPKKKKELVLNWPPGKDVVKTKHVKVRFVALKPGSDAPPPAAPAPAGVPPVHHAPLPPAPRPPPPIEGESVSSLSALLKSGNMVEAFVDSDWWDARVASIRLAPTPAGVGKRKAAVEIDYKGSHEGDWVDAHWVVFHQKHGEWVVASDSIKIRPRQPGSTTVSPHIAPTKTTQAEPTTLSLGGAAKAEDQGQSAVEKAQLKSKEKQKEKERVKEPGTGGKGLLGSQGAKTGDKDQEKQREREEKEKEEKAKEKQRLKEAERGKHMDKLKEAASRIADAPPTSLADSMFQTVGVARYTNPPRDWPLYYMSVDGTKVKFRAFRDPPEYSKVRVVCKGADAWTRNMSESRSPADDDESASSSFASSPAAFSPDDSTVARHPQAPPTLVSQPSGGKGMAKASFVPPQSEQPEEGGAARDSKGEVKKMQSAESAFSSPKVANDEEAAREKKKREKKEKKERARQEAAAAAAAAAASSAGEEETGRTSVGSLGKGGEESGTELAGVDKALLKAKEKEQAKERAKEKEKEGEASADGKKEKKEVKDKEPKEKKEDGGGMKKEKDGAKGKSDDVDEEEAKRRIVHALALRDMDRAELRERCRIPRLSKGVIKLVGSVVGASAEGESRKYALAIENWKLVDVKTWAGYSVEERCIVRGRAKSLGGKGEAEGMGEGKKEQKEEKEKERGNEQAGVKENVKEREEREGKEKEVGGKKEDEDKEKDGSTKKERKEKEKENEKEKEKKEEKEKEKEEKEREEKENAGDEDAGGGGAGETLSAVEKASKKSKEGKKEREKEEREEEREKEKEKQRERDEREQERAEKKKEREREREAAKEGLEGALLVKSPPADADDGRKERERKEEGKERERREEGKDDSGLGKKRGREGASEDEAGASVDEGGVKKDAAGVSKPKDDLDTLLPPVAKKAKVDGEGGDVLPPIPKAKAEDVKAKDREEERKREKERARREEGEKKEGGKREEGRRDSGSLKREGRDERRERDERKREEERRESDGRKREEGRRDDRYYDEKRRDERRKDERDQRKRYNDSPRRREDDRKRDDRRRDDRDRERDRRDRDRDRDRDKERERERERDGSERKAVMSPGRSSGAEERPDSASGKRKEEGEAKAKAVEAGKEEAKTQEEREGGQEGGSGVPAVRESERAHKGGVEEKQRVGASGGGEMREEGGGVGERQEEAAGGAEAGDGQGAVGREGEGESAASREEEDGGVGDQGGRDEGAAAKVERREVKRKDEKSRAGDGEKKERQVSESPKKREGEEGKRDAGDKEKKVSETEGKGGRTAEGGEQKRVEGKEGGKKAEAEGKEERKRKEDKDERKKEGKEDKRKEDKDERKKDGKEVKGGIGHDLAKEVNVERNGAGKEGGKEGGKERELKSPTPTKSPVQLQQSPDAAKEAKDKEGRGRAKEKEGKEAGGELSTTPQRKSSASPMPPSPLLSSSRPPEEGKPRKRALEEDWAEESRPSKKEKKSEDGGKKKKREGGEEEEEAKRGKEAEKKRKKAGASEEGSKKKVSPVKEGENRRESGAGAEEEGRKEKKAKGGSKEEKRPKKEKKEKKKAAGEGAPPETVARAPSLNIPSPDTDIDL